MEPEELQAEPRWSSIRYAPHPLPSQWKRATDERLMLLVTQSTASGERFPVGVNWLEVSRVVRRSPVDCVKRYAVLHEAQERYEEQEGEAQGLEGKTNATADGGALEGEVEGAFLDSGDEFFEEQSLSDFATPVASPKLDSLGASKGFMMSRPISPVSSPPFAVTRPDVSRQTEPAVPGRDPFRWESLANDPNYNAPMLHSPLSSRHTETLPSRSGSVDHEAKGLSCASSPRLSSRGLMSPSCTQGHVSDVRGGPNYTASVLTHAFKGLAMSAQPSSVTLTSSPRLSDTISNSEHPFFKDEGENTFVRHSATTSVSRFGIGSRVAASPSNDVNEMGVGAGHLHRRVNPHLVQMSATSEDNLFSGSVTQSALEDAFLDMAGSRLDASNVLLGSRMSTPLGSHVHLPSGQLQARSTDCAPRQSDGKVGNSG